MLNIIVKGTLGIMSGNKNARKESTNQAAFNEHGTFFKTSISRHVPALLRFPTFHKDREQRCAGKTVIENPLMVTSSICESLESDLAKNNTPIQRRPLKFPDVSAMIGEHSSKESEYLPRTDDFLTTKFTPKDRYEIEAIRGYTCDLCKLGSLTCVCKKSTETPLESIFESSISLSNSSIPGGLDSVPRRRKKKIVVNMPRTDDIYEEDSDIAVKPIFQYKHTNK